MSKHVMPLGVGYVYIFQVFNTLSFSILVGAPMLLYFRGLGASDTVLGIVAALTPLLNMLQIPAARFVELVGYRRFVVRGWTVRSFLVLVMAVVVILPPVIDNPTKMALMLLLLVFWNGWRGISVCAILPWFTKLVPEEVRGRFVSRDQLAMGLSMAGSLVLNGFILEGVGPSDDSRWKFGGLFLFSFLAAIISLRYLSRIPDVPVERDVASRQAPPWLAMLRHPPFAKVLVYHVFVLSAFSAAGVFWIPFFQQELRVGPSNVLNWAALSSLVAALSLVYFGPVVDRVGSRPVLALAGILFTLHFCGWGAMAAEVYPTNAWTMVFQQVTAGLGSGTFNLAITRLLMGTVPEMGRSHFFALYSVVTSLAMGSFPVLWGILLDTLGPWESQWGAWEWNRFSVLYAVLATTILCSNYLLPWLHEPKAMRTDEFLTELLFKSPARAMTRLLPRRPVA